MSLLGDIPQRLGYDSRELLGESKINAHSRILHLFPVSTPQNTTHFPSLACKQNFSGVATGKRCRIRELTEFYCFSRRLASLPGGYSRRNYSGVEAREKMRDSRYFTGKDAANLFYRINFPELGSGSTGKDVRQFCSKEMAF
jgi:hypothetical protein